MKHVIIGNGPAGVVAAETLRRVDPGSQIELIGEEESPPYSRMAIPYLLMGAIDEAGTHLRKDPAHFERLGIRLVRGRVEAINAGAKRLRFADGTQGAYDRLLIATGSHPIRPPVPGVDTPGVHACWTLEDARHIAAAARRGGRVVQIGAGFIGCIVLEALASRGLEITVVEMGSRMVPRMMTEGASALIRKWCEAKGVEVRTRARVEAIRSRGAALEVKLSTGGTVAADLVICAAGVAPNIAFLNGSGIATGRGVLVDERMQASVAGVYAAGDVAEAVDFNTGERTLNAIQPNAVEQGRIAALNMAGRDASSQGALAINVLDTLGLISSSFGRWAGVAGGDSAEALDERAWRYLSLQFGGDVLIGATAIGHTEHIGVLRGLIQGRTPLGHWKGELLRDPTRIMQAWLSRSQAQDIRMVPRAR
ncbi:MAG: FAD-dependent oxidoreductase [Rhodocyclaceae bacterium]